MEVTLHQPNPWLTIWTSPRTTIRRIVETNPEYRVTLLAVLAGFAEALNNVAERGVGDDVPWLALILLCLVIGSLGGLFSLYLAGAIFRATGAWLGGQGTSTEVRTAIAWSSVPQVWALLFWIPELLLFQEELFTSKMPRIESNPFLLVALTGFAVVRLIIGLWSFVIFIQGLAEVHQFSGWKALAAALLPTLIIGVPLLACVALLSLS